MAEMPPPTNRPRDLPTIIAISIVAFAIADILHEGAGHGGACLLTGGHAQLLSTVHFQCDQSNRLIAAGGTLANLIAGLLCWIALRAINPSREHWRYFLWLLMSINLMEGTGYFLLSGLINFGDWAEVIQGLQHPWLWRGALTIFGATSHLLVIWIALLALRQFLGEQDYRKGAIKNLTLVPYLAGGVLSVIAGMLNPMGWIFVADSAAATSLGGTFGLVWMTEYLGTRFAPKIASRPLTLPRIRGWLIAAALTAAIFIGILGRGIRFH